jgi:hypothetical protein
LILIVHQAVLKEWITDPGVVVFIAPVLDSTLGIVHAQGISGRSLVRDRVPNPGTRDAISLGKMRIIQMYKSIAMWTGPRQAHEQFGRRIFEISGRVEPANARFAEFMSQFSKEEVVIITFGLTPAES